MDGIRDRPFLEQYQRPASQVWDPAGDVCFDEQQSVRDGVAEPEQAKDQPPVLEITHQHNHDM